MKLLIVILSVLVSACSTPRAVPYNVINNLEPDCGNKEVMLSWLNRQTNQESSFMTVDDKAYNIAVKKLIWRIRAECSGS